YEATVRNAEGLPLPDITVNWSADNSNVTLSQNQTISDANGVAAMTVSSKKAGSVIITAQTSESAPFQAEAAIFTADPTTARVGALSSDKQRALANGTAAIKVSATVVDANENPLSAAEVKWAVSPSTGQLSATSSTTQADGVADVLLTT
ncbi:Ig-like domain-containing protein, partial [Pseudomonas putida]|uniref:Ig-like domain-containing protein n=2 Tax=Gammaproteobacteria TaxID=1236 RepID=UPI003132B73B